MDESYDASHDLESAPAFGDESAEQASRSFVGRWNRLVSTTNWEKGRIIAQWREAIVDAGGSAAEYSDEAWSRLVGGVTGQHVGRLRRVYQRFGLVHDQYESLYWSHFHAALDWDDAEMWLEGAVQSNWSVSQMRRTRWETLGGDAAAEPDDEQIVRGELDEDFEPAIHAAPAAGGLSPSYDEVRSTPRIADQVEDDDAHSYDEAPAGDEDDPGASIYTDDSRDAVKFVQPFANLADLPDDLAEAFEAFKLAILRHKADDWQSIAREDVLASLDALKELALAPSSDAAPF